MLISSTARAFARLSGVMKSLNRGFHGKGQQLPPWEASAHRRQDPGLVFSLPSDDGRTALVDAVAG